MKPEGHGVIFIALRESRQSIIMYPTKLFFPKIKKLQELTTRRFVFFKKKRKLTSEQPDMQEGMRNSLINVGKCKQVFRGTV